MDPVQQELHLRDYLRMFRKRLGLIAGVFVAVMAVVVAYVLLARPLYQAKATVQVQGQSGFVIRAAAQSLDDSSGNLTPTALTELIASEPYQELASSLLNLSQGYDIDLTARHSSNDMVQLFEENLMTRPLPAFFGRLALQASSSSRTRYRKIGLGLDAANAEEVQENDFSRMTQQLSSAEKDEAIRQAGALAALARRFHLNLFNKTVEEIGPQASEIMNSSLVRDLRTKPLRGKSWEALPPLERAAAVQAAYREVAKRFPDAPDKAAAKENYSTREIKDTGMLDIAFTSPDAGRAMYGADAMVDVAVWKNQYLRKEDAQRLRMVAENALVGPSGNGGIKGQLNKTAISLRDYKNNKHIADLEATKDATAKQLVEVQINYQSAFAGVEGSQKTIALLQQKLSEVSPKLHLPSTEENIVLPTIKGELYKAQAGLQALRAQYTDDNPRVLSAIATVKKYQNELNAETSSKPDTQQMREINNPVYEGLQAELNKAQSQYLNFEALRRRYKGQLDQQEAKLALVPNTEYEMGKSMQDYLTLQSNFHTLGDRYLDAQFNEATKVSNAKVVELAMEPGKKIRPRRGMSLVFGVLLGLFLGLAGAVLAETMDSKLYSREELERLLPDSPVLAAIPAFRADRPLVVSGGGSFPVTEAFRSLRSAVRFLGMDTPLQSLVVTSPGLGEGKSLIAANLAAAMAQSGQRVILVDANLRHPAQHEILAVPNVRGLTSVLMNESTLDSVLQGTDVEGLSVLTSGPLPPNPAELLDSAAMRKLTGDLRERTDVIIYDAPPALVSDAALLGSLTQGALLVAGAGQTSREDLLRAVKTLNQARIRVLGLVLNRTDPSSEGVFDRYQQYADNGAGLNGQSKSGKKTKVRL